jgi:hypothetical protein
MKRSFGIFLFLLTCCCDSLAQDVDFMKYRGGYLDSSRDLATENGFYYIYYPGQHSSSLLSFTTGTSTGTFQMEAFYWGELKFRNKTDNNAWQGWKTIWTDANLNPNNYVQKNANGHVGIGTVPRNDYRLAVEGTVGARKVKVTQESWADFVFDPQYQLPTLLDVELFIQKHKHLPEIPSTSEVLDEGIDLGDMNKKLLQKVEELTLYVIELKKENERQQKQLDKLDKRF